MWCYVPSACIRSLDGQLFDVDHPALTHYNSSENIDRTFCSMCGAKVFYRKRHDVSPDAQWDIAVGLFEGEGSRLDDWLDWDPAELAFADEAIDEELFRGMMNGIEAHYQKLAGTYG